jgi:hypothetical protein
MFEKFDCISANYPFFTFAPAAHNDSIETAASQAAYTKELS